MAEIATRHTGREGIPSKSPRCEHEGDKNQPW